MRELEREQSEATAPVPPALAGRLAILGSGRAGGSLAEAAAAAGFNVRLGSRDASVADASIVLLCVPDVAIRATCEALAPSLESGTFVGHVSGASRLNVLESAAAAGARTFSLHPLQTIPTSRADLAGAPCAIAGSDTNATAVARALAERLGMVPFGVPEEGRAAYHAAAAMASNFLIALEESSVQLLEAAGVSAPREVLAPLVLRSAANWADAGAEALTGPIARGDTETVALHLEALAEKAPELRRLYEALAERTRELGAP